MPLDPGAQHAATELIARLEAAIEGSRELDDAVANATGYTTRLRTAPPYTTSLDAALSLVPPEWSWRVGNLPSARRFASLGTQEVEGATPALALCIACLRARSQ